MIEINERKIGAGFKPYVIAELSGNHGGNIYKAKNLIRAAKISGASAVKIQSYTADTITINAPQDDFKIVEGPWAGRSLHELYSEAETPFEWHKELFEYAEKLGITLFSSPFDETAIDLLTDLNTPAFKIASFELTDYDLISYAAKNQKPMLLSTGMADIEEIAGAVEASKKVNNSQILLFHCISDYPAATHESKMSNITYLQRYFKTEVGLSDHTTSNLCSVMAIAMGASAIEKHFKADTDDYSVDADFSLTPKEFEQLLADVTLAFQALGQKPFARSKSELKNKRFRRSLYFVKEMTKGQVITPEHVKRIRPGFGLEPKYLKDVIGSKVSRNVSVGDRCDWTCLEDILPKTN